ncbi:MAG: hypothetical protein HYW24_05105 [Candidatus Aenigmarchaeota archaeon]|nr:hypothetical protein [Candidatus Aenigmarchaeota archaeon]
MPTEEIIKRRLKKLKSVHPAFDEEQLERELIPLSGEEIAIRKKKKL